MKPFHSHICTVVHSAATTFNPPYSCEKCESSSQTLSWLAMVADGCKCRKVVLWHAQWLHGACGSLWKICVPTSLPWLCTARSNSMHTYAYTHIVRKKLRDRCLFMCVKEHMWTQTCALCKDGERREDQKNKLKGI